MALTPSAYVDNNNIMVAQTSGTATIDSSIIGKWRTTPNFNGITIPKAGKYIICARGHVWNDNDAYPKYLSIGRPKTPDSSGNNFNSGAILAVLKIKDMYVSGSTIMQCSDNDNITVGFYISNEGNIANVSMEAYRIGD